MTLLLDSDRGRYAKGLLVLLVFFIFRVLGQLIQAVHPISLLPSFDAWQGSRLPYWMLLSSQIIIIFLFSTILLRILKGTTRPSLALGRVLLVIGTLYFGVMIVRLFVGTFFLPDHDWFGARIPAFFHLVLSSFVLLLGRFHYRCYEDTV